MIVLTWRRINNYRYKININYFIVCFKLERSHHISIDLCTSDNKFVSSQSGIIIFKIHSNIFTVQYFN